MKIGIVKRLLTEALVADKCNICHKVTEQKVQVQQEMFVLALPMFPTGKTGKVICTQCKTELPLPLMPPYAMRKYVDMLPTAKTTLWAYTFPIIMAVVVVIMLIKEPGEMSKRRELIDSAKAGDVYRIGYEDNARVFNKSRYTMWKVVAVSGDEVYLVESLFDVGDIRDLSDIKRKDDIEQWGGDTIMHNKEWLKKQASMFADGKKVEEVERK